MVTLSMVLGIFLLLSLLGHANFALQRGEPGPRWAGPDVGLVVANIFYGEVVSEQEALTLRGVGPRCCLGVFLLISRLVLASRMGQM